MNIQLPIGQMNQLLNSKQEETMSSPVALVTFKQIVVGEAKNNTTLKSLVYADLTRLYEIVMDEAEGFDGEKVEVEFMIDRMARRYKVVGLSPSRN